MMNSNVDRICMTLPCRKDKDYVRVVRMAVSAIADQMGFNVEDMEDIKLALSEGCSNAIRHSKGSFFEVEFLLGGGALKISVMDKGQGCPDDYETDPDLLNPKEEGGLGIYIIKSIMDEVSISTKCGEGTRIEMTKILEESK